MKNIVYGLKKMLKVFNLYTLIAFISVLIRQEFLPTPAEAMGFEVLGIKGLINVFNGKESITALFVGLIGFVINIAIEAPLHKVTFWTVGKIYSPGDGGYKGSILYLIVYLLNIGLLTLIPVVGFNKGLMWLFAGYTGCLITIATLYFKLNERFI